MPPCPLRVVTLRLAVVVGILAGLAALSTAAPPAIAGEPGAAAFVAVRIESVTPDVVTTTSDPEVTVTGTVLNVGDRLVRTVLVRLEHAAAVASSAGLRTNLDGANDQFRGVGGFVTVADQLRQGQSAPFRLSAPLRSLTRPSLGIDQPGVYPVLVNVNATPDYGDQARLDDARFLLPVLGVPPDRDAAPGTDPLAAMVTPDTSKPVRITMLWPLADRPRLAAGAPGGTVPVRLSDDELATSLAPGGRLDILLSSAEFVTTPAVDPDGAVGRSLCLAVDPDLLVTVTAMTAGYLVPDAPGSAATHPGVGEAAARTWLDRLRSLAHRSCVAPIPYAQADLDALQRVGAAGLTEIAVGSSADIVDQILGVTATRGAALLADGPFTRPVADLLGAQHPGLAIAAGECSAQDSATGTPATADVALRRVSPQLVVAPFDPAVGAALAAVGADPVAPTYLDPSLTVGLAHDSPTARRQDALAALLWRGLEPGAVSRAEILLPPAFWSPRADDAHAILTTLGTALRSGLAVPRPLSALISEAQSVPGTAPLAQSPQPPQPAPGRFDDDVTAQVRAELARLGSLTSALTTNTQTGMTGIGYTAPLREDLLRALSQAQPPQVRNAAARQRLGIVDHTIGDLFAAVTVVNPGGSYTLATEHSPLPVALRNDLAVPIRVRLQVTAPPGMTVDDPGEIVLLPGFLPLRVPTEVRLNQRVAVDVALRTPDGVALGAPVRLSVHANAYGKVLFAITMTAAAALLALAGRRLWHRFRGQPDRADLDRPDPVTVASRFAAEHPSDDEPRR